MRTLCRQTAIIALSVSVCGCAWLAGEVVHAPSGEAPPMPPVMAAPPPPPPPQQEAAAPPAEAAEWTIARREFVGPLRFPPREYHAGYGIVAFSTLPYTVELRRRAEWICEAYVAKFTVASVTAGATSKEMTTVWPVTSDGLARKLNGKPAYEPVCPAAVKNYDLESGQKALRAAGAGKAGKVAERSEGPVLLAWAPSNNMGRAGALVLVLDLSYVQTPTDADKAMQKWGSLVEHDNRLWSNNYNLDFNVVATIIKNFLDNNGHAVMTAVDGPGVPGQAAKRRT